MTLRALARLYGIQTAYYGINRKRIEAAPEALLETLRHLGAPVESSRDISAAVRERRLALWKRVMEPVVVAWNGGPLEIEIRLPAEHTRGSLWFQVDLEDGSRRRGTRRLNPMPTTGREGVEGSRYETKRFTLPGKLPSGYHRLTIDTPVGAAKTTIISAPLEAYVPSDHRNGSWGIFVPIYALHTHRSWGTGDYSDLEALVDWTARFEGQVVSTLPFLAAFLDEPFEPSPYSPASRLFWNELYVDPRRAPEWDSCPKARQRFESPRFQRELERLRVSPKVDYRGCFARKREILELLAEALFRRRSSRLSDLERFIESRPQLQNYARFRATTDRLRTPWPRWSARLREGSLRPSDFHAKDFRYHVYAQWLASRQTGLLAKKARERGAGLYLDLPLGAHPAGYDTWSEQAIFVRDATVGAPPDPVFTGGQNWGFPPLHPEKSREQGHRYFVACIRHQLGSAGLLRIDHVMGLHRMFWIARGFDFREGVYVRYPAEELYAILSLESHRHRSVIVGENLGIVPGYVNRAMTRHNIQQMYLMQYALRPNPERPVKPIPSGSVASLNSHDTPLFSAFWQGMDIADRLRLGLLDARGAKRERNERKTRKKALLAHFRRKGLARKRGGKRDELSRILGACLARLRRSRAGIVLVSLEDLWLETEPQNVPGAGEKRPNWQRKLRYSLEELSRQTGVIDKLRRMQASVADSAHRPLDRRNVRKKS